MFPKRPNQKCLPCSALGHNFVVNGEPNQLRSVARLKDPASGRVMTLTANQPGVQFYTGNFLDGTLVGKSGKAYQRRSGFCLETQHYPDSPNKLNFPTIKLKKRLCF